MALPKIVTPTYYVVLPSKKEVIKVRPFLMKEEKVLLMAAEGGEKTDMIDAIRQMLSGCILTDKIVIEELPLFDIEYLFLKIRAKSVGETVSIVYGHKDGVNNKGDQCNKATTITINLEEIEVVMTKDHSPKIQLTDNIGMVLDYPKIEIMGHIKESVTYEDGLKMIANSVSMVWEGDDISEKGSFTEKEMIEFLESLDKDQFGKVERFFETMPRVKHETSYICEECGEEVKIILEGIDDFFG